MSQLLFHFISLDFFSVIQIRIQKTPLAVDLGWQISSFVRHCARCEEDIDPEIRNRKCLEKKTCGPIVYFIQSREIVDAGADLRPQAKREDLRTHNQYVAEGLVLGSRYSAPTVHHQLQPKTW